MNEDYVSKLIRDIAASPHGLKRLPEADSVMSEAESVDNFNEVMRTNLTVNYAAAMDYLHRARNEPTDGSPSLLDLCSGPGHFTLCLSEHLNYADLSGQDLSPGMVRNAQANASKLGKPIKFSQGNVLELKDSNRYDAVTCANASHHFERIEDVAQMLRLADRACRRDGIVVLTDLCRLPNQDVSERFITMIGQDYVDSGLPALAADFRASMFAAWSPDEMALAFPRDSERNWFQVVAGGLPFFQAVIGLPIGRKDLFIRESKDWAASGLFRTARAEQAWELTKGGYYAGLIRKLNSPATTRKAA